MPWKLITTICIWNQNQHLLQCCWQLSAMKTKALISYLVSSYLTQNALLNENCSLPISIFLILHKATSIVTCCANMIQNPASSIVVEELLFPLFVNKNLQLIYLWGGIFFNYSKYMITLTSSTISSETKPWLTLWCTGPVYAPQTFQLYCLYRQPKIFFHDFLTLECLHLALKVSSSWASLSHCHENCR